MALQKIGRGMLNTGVSDSSDATAITIDSSENIGIGETSPLGKLHAKVSDTGASASAQGNLLVLEDTENGLSILSSTSAAGYINFGDSDDNDIGMIIYDHSANAMRFWTNAAERMRIDTNGNIAIGGTSASNFSGYVTLDLRDTTGGIIDFSEATAGVHSRIQAVVNNSLNILNRQNYPLHLGTNDTTRLTITGGGNVGIGTTSPAQKLHVDGEVKATSADITDTSGNTSIGYGALNNLTSGDSNVAVGYESLEDVTDGTHNVSVGYRTAMNITGGDYNTAVGNYALTTLTTQSYNTAVGYYALGGATTGQQNTGVGYYSLPVMTTALYNTAIGLQSGRDCTTGSDNLFLGYRAGDGPSPSGSVTTQSNYIVVGNNSSTNAYIKIDWTVTSDKRDKTDIEPLTMGLDLVNKLNPVTYRWDMRSDYEDNKPDGTHKKEKLSGGLIAQDVEVLEREYGYKVEDKTSILTDKNADGNYGLTYSKFVPVLINAVKELSAELQELKAKVESE